MPLRDIILDKDDNENILGEQIRFNSGICIKITKNK